MKQWLGGGRFPSFPQLPRPPVAWQIILLNNMNKETFDRTRSCDWKNPAVFIPTSYIQFSPGHVFCWFLHSYLREMMFLECSYLGLAGKGRQQVVFLPSAPNLYCEVFLFHFHEHFWVFLPFSWFIMPIIVLCTFMIILREYLSDLQ